MIIVIGIAYELYSKHDHLILNKSKRTWANISKLIWD
jgi:hypothetical protein